MSWTALRAGAQSCTTTAEFQELLRKTLKDMNCAECTEHARAYFPAHPLRASYGSADFVRYVADYHANVDAMKSEKHSTGILEGLLAMFGGVTPAHAGASAVYRGGGGGCRSCGR